MIVTVKEYVEQVDERYPEKVRPIVMACEYIWSNEACYGYCAKALRNLGASESDVQAVMGELHSVFDVMAVCEAEQVAW